MSDPPAKTYTILLGGSVDRATGKVTLHTRQGTREEFAASLVPLIEMGRSVREMEEAERKRAVQP